MNEYKYTDPSGNKRDFNGNNKKQLSSFQPSKEWRDLLFNIWRDDAIGEQNLTTMREELDGESIRTAFWKYYKSFIGSTTTHASSDPESDWQTYVHKPIIQNKSQIFIAHAVADLMFPYYTAQDANSIPDQDKSVVIQLLAERIFTNPEFQDKIIRAVTTVAYSPFAIIEKGFDNGQHFIKMIDPTAFKFANYYESNIQKQRFVIKDELIDFFDAERLYGKTEFWSHVNPGQEAYFNAQDGLYYYRAVTADRQHLVFRKTYYNQYHDLEITLINGIPVSKINQKIKRLGKKKNRPYPFSTVMFEHLGRETIVGRPLAQKLWSDERLASFMQSLAYDMSRQAVTPSMISYGDQNITARAFAPGTVINAGADKNFEMRPVMSNINLSPAISILDMITRNSEESSGSDALRGGITGSGSSAREVVIANNNAKTIQQGTFFKNMEKFIRELGYLILDDIFQYELVKNIDKVTGKIGYSSTFVLQEGKDVNVVRLQNETPEDPYEHQLKVLNEIEKNGYKSLYEIAPEDYKNIDYITDVSIEYSQSKNKDLQKALAIEFHQVMSPNPYYNLLNGTKKLTEQYYPTEVDDLVKEPTQQPDTNNPMTPGGSVTPEQAIQMQQQTQTKMPTTNQLLNNTIDTLG